MKPSEAAVPQMAPETIPQAAEWSADNTSDLLVRLAQEKGLGNLMQRILREARGLTGAEGGTFYRFIDDGDNSRLAFSVVHNTVLGIETMINEGQDQGWPPIQLYKDGEPNHRNVASHVGLTRQAVNIPDVYDAEMFDFTGTRHFDAAHDYRSQSMLTLPLLNHEDDIIGVMQLINARDAEGNTRAFSPEDQATVQAMAKFAAITLDNQLLVQSHKDLLDAFIQALARIIDVRSAHTSAHCQRIPVLTELIAQAACEDTEGVFADFQLNDDEWYELHVAAWLHDCGKLATSENVLNKGRKLQKLHDGFDAVRARFATAIAVAQSEDEKAALRDDLEFIDQVNRGGEFMSDEFKARIERIATGTWPDAYGEARPLLTEDEVYNLNITRGTINNEERAEINRHIDITIDILEGLPFPPKLRRVPEYAGGHHERMDGKGYPRGLTRDQLSIPARMMGVADIFEALTAKERPYKPPMPLSQAFTILRRMRDDNHIDGDVFELFLRSGKWRKYAQDHLLPEQDDIEDVEQFITGDA